MAGTQSKRMKDSVLRTVGESRRSHVRIERDYNSVKPHITAYAQSLASMLLGIPDAGAVRVHVKDAGEVIAALSKLRSVPKDTLLTQATYLGLLPDIALLTVVYAWPDSWVNVHRSITDSLNICSPPAVRVNMNRTESSAVALKEQGCDVAHGDTHLPQITYRVKTTVSQRSIGATICLVHSIDDFRELLAVRAGEQLGDSMLQPVLLAIDRASDRLFRIASGLSRDRNGNVEGMDPAQSLEALEGEIKRLQTPPESRTRLLELVSAARNGLALLQAPVDSWDDDVPARSARRPDVVPAPESPPSTPPAETPDVERPPSPVGQSNEQPAAAARGVELETPVSMKETLLFRRTRDPGIVDTLELIRRALDEVQSDQQNPTS